MQGGLTVGSPLALKERASREYDQAFGGNSPGLESWLSHWLAVNLEQATSPP